MADYKRIFRITKILRNHNLPDDLIQRIFEYVGEINESIIDLKNSHAFTQFFQTGTEACYGTYCHYCDKVLVVSSANHLARHIRSRTHSQNVNQNAYISISSKHLLKRFKQKYEWCSHIRRAVKNNKIDTLKVQYKKPYY